MFALKLPVRFTLFLFLSLTIGFCTHLGILHMLELPLFENLIVLSYGINFVLAFIIFIVLYMLREKFKNAIGFLYMGGSLFKFLVFFLVFYGPYKADGKMLGLEFAAFFVPYGIALILETIFTAQMLKRIEYSK